MRRRPEALEYDGLFQAIPSYWYYSHNIVSSNVLLDYGPWITNVRLEVDAIVQKGEWHEPRLNFEAP